MPTPSLTLPWLEPGALFPPPASAWPQESDAPGLLAAGGDLSVNTLRKAYSLGIFPWFSEGQPILWWSPNPRMVLQTANFKLHRSLRKTLLHFLHAENCEVRFNSAFRQVIEACATSHRNGQPGTWILPEMVEAYTRLHQAGHAHSVETWIDNQLVGGLYCVCLGRGVFGESMFTRVPNASKIALSALVAFCKGKAITVIDCQQNTPHLASLGASEIPRNIFLKHVAQAQTKPAVKWQFSPLYWQQILTTP